MKFDTSTTPRGIQNLQFNLDWFPHVTLKAFNEFIEQCWFQYAGQYPEPLKHSIEAYVTKWTAKTKKEPAHTDTEFEKNIQKNMDLKRQIKTLLGFFCNN